MNANVVGDWLVIAYVGFWSNLQLCKNFLLHDQGKLLQKSSRIYCSTARISAPLLLRIVFMNGWADGASSVL